jgi:hypothetical protein
MRMADKFGQVPPRCRVLLATLTPVQSLLLVHLVLELLLNMQLILLLLQQLILLVLQQKLVLVLMLVLTNMLLQ